MKIEKLNLEALKQRAEAMVSKELLETISGGLESSCHVTYSCDNCSVTIQAGTIKINP